jgi:uncharacterized protein YcnI
MGEIGKPVKRVGALVFCLGIALALQAAPAWAHVSVDATPAQAGAAKAQLMFKAAAESKAAGIIKLEFLADPAIPSDVVTLVAGPAGWKLGPGSFGGFVVEGPALPVGEDAKVTLQVRQLPQAKQVVFKVLESYTDGKIDRWTELPGADGKEPEHPASILELSAAAPSAAASPTPAAPSAAPAPKPAATHAEEHRHAEAAGESLARTGSGNRSLALLSGLLLLLGGAGILAGVGRQGIEP